MNIYAIVIVGAGKNRTLRIPLREDVHKKSGNYKERKNV